MPRAWLAAGLTAGLTAGLFAVGPVGCGPDIPPEYLVQRTTPATIQTEVVAAGPLAAADFDPSSGRFHDAMPLDTVRLTVEAVDVDGLVAPDALDPFWAVCGTRDGCPLQAIAADADPPACGDELLPDETCSPGRGNPLDMTLADAPDDLLPSLVASTLSNPFASGPRVFAITGTPDGPTTEQCRARLSDRAALRGCLVITRSVAMGPPGSMIALYEARTDEPTLELEDIPPELLEQPRNRIPTVVGFNVSTVGRDGRSQTQLVDPGMTVSIELGDRVTVAPALAEGDVELFSLVTTDGGNPSAILFEETINARWLSTAEVDDLEIVGASVRWGADRPVDPFIQYVIVGDSRGAEVVSWLAFEVDS